MKESIEELKPCLLVQEREARAHDEFLRRKVDAGRRDMCAGRGRSQCEVEAYFVARRAKLLRRAGELGA